MSSARIAAVAAITEATAAIAPMTVVMMNLRVALRSFSAVILSFMFWSSTLVGIRFSLLNSGILKLSVFIFAHSFLLGILPRQEERCKEVI